METLREAVGTDRRRRAALALLLGWLLALCAGCPIRDAYDVEKEEPPETRPQGIPDYRMPDLPETAPPSPSPSGVAAPQESFSPRMLERIAGMATSPPQDFKYSLDERLRRYHRWACPYGCIVVSYYYLACEGPNLVARKTNRTTGTRMSRAEIKVKGYRPCPHCRPDLDRAPQWYAEEESAVTGRPRRALPYDAIDRQNIPEAPR